MKSALTVTICAISLLVAPANAGSLTLTDPEGYPFVVDAHGYQTEAAVDLAVHSKADAKAVPAGSERFAIRGQDALPDPKARCCDVLSDAIAY